MKHFKLVLVLLAGLALISGCESDKSDKLNKAQTCLDDVDAANYANASACLDDLDGVSGSQADLLRCSISLFAGGITTVRVANAFKALDSNGGGAASEAYLMTALAMDDTTKADTAYAYCKASGIASLEYIGSLAVIGTQLANAGGFLGTITSGGSGYIPNTTDVTNAISMCTSQACQAAIGAALLPIADSYCADGGDQAACDQINSAVDNAGGDSERVGELLLCLMQSPPVQPASCP